MRNLCFNCPYNKGLELGNGCGNDTCIQENMLFEKDEEPVEISCWRAVMEQKERYEWNSRFDEAIKDNQTGDIVNAVEVLNQQDKRIKELEDLVIEYKNKLYRRLDQVDNLIKENQQLKQQLAITEKALELAVKDKCKFENALLSTSLGIAGGKVAVPKKEQYYIEQAKEILENE